MVKVIKPSKFGKSVPCDRLRDNFDKHNEQILDSARQVDVVFIGDSITEFWNVDAYFGDLGFVVNRGVGGDTTDYILMRSDADVFQLKPKAMVYLAGINDLLNPTPNVWLKTDWTKDKKEIVDSVIENVEKMMIKCVNNQVKGYFVSLLPTDFRPPYNGFGVEEMIVEVNEKIKRLAKDLGVEFIDCYKEICKQDEPRIFDGYTDDCVHPSVLGYNAISKIIKRELLKRKYYE